MSIWKTPPLTNVDSAKPEKSASATAAPTGTSAPPPETDPARPRTASISIQEPAKPVTSNTSQSEFPAAQAEPTTAKPAEPAQAAEAVKPAEPVSKTGKRIPEYSCENTSLIAITDAPAQ